MARTDDRRNKARERARAQAEDNKYTGGTSYLKLPEGMRLIKLEKKTYEFDFLPFEITKNRTVPDTAKRDMDFEKGEIWWQRSIFIHRNVGPDKKYILCPRTVKKPCPICEERKLLMEDWDANEEQIRELKPQHKDLMFAIDLDNEKEGIGVVEHSYANFREVIEKELREQDKEEYFDFFQLDDGFTLKVRVIEDTYMKSTFYKADRIDFEKRSNYKESILQETFDFDDCFVLLPYDKIYRMLQGVEDEEPEDTSDDRKSDKKADKEPEKEERSSSRSSRKEEPEPEKEEKKESTRSSSRRQEPEPEPEKEKEPVRERKTREEPKKEDSGECPFKHEFGTDCDKHDDCPDCPKETWEKCADRHDELKKKK